MASITYGDGLRPVDYNANGYLYAGIVTVSGRQAYKVGFTKDPTLRYCKCERASDMLYLVIQEQPAVFDQMSPAQLTRFEKKIHYKLKMVLNQQQVKSIQYLMWSYGFEGYTECYPLTDKTAVEISRVIGEVLEEMDGLVDKANLSNTLH
ncbi:hypothetical protein CK627_20840 [Aeromonas dhakensis]|uniref:hypothetical protein n=1 Tax=Aeromonas dhakensis TaxID=196024 RepID=UPI000BAADD8D|nr:hypothetical protein [Aeromonas dhakensis]ASX13056.1 hypothetical protein CK627_20840 [Aeromonas dhakensis]